MKKLVIFNLRVDPSSPILGASIDWIEGFKNHFEITDVVSTYVDKNFRLENTRILEIGGGSLGARFLAILKLFKFALFLIPKRKEYVVFHHMSPRTAVFPGILFKVFGINQGLWYSHSSRPLALKLAIRIVDYIFSSEKNSFPITSFKAHFVGHGISLKKFGDVQLTKRRSSSVLFLGRLSRIKNLHKLIDAVAMLEEKIPITLIGPQSDKEYLEELEKSASKKNVTLIIKDSVNHDEVSQNMQQFKYFYSGMEKSVDKSALEAAISGCLVLTTDLGTQDLSGMKEVWDNCATIDFQTVDKQIEFLENLGQKELASLQEIVRSEAIAKNNLEKNISQICAIMESER